MITATIGTTRTHSGRNCTANEHATTVHNNVALVRRRTNATAASTAKAQNNAAAGSADAAWPHRNCSGINAAITDAKAPARELPVSAVVRRNTTATIQATIVVFNALAMPSLTPKTLYARLK